MSFFRNSMLVIFLLASSKAAHAKWPEFGAPLFAFLQNQGYVDTQQCPPQQGKLIPNIGINIKTYFCQTYCPDDWSWVTQSDGRCHDITDLQFQRYEIRRYPDQDGVTSYSEAIAHYGKRGADQSLFQLRFKTKPGEHWYCFEIDVGRHIIICGNDTLTSRPTNLGS